LFVVSAFSVISSYTFGKLSDKLGRKTTLIISCSIYCLTLLGFFCFYFFYVQKFFVWLILILLFALYGLSYGSITALQPVFAIDLAEKTPAEASGILATFFGFSALIASTIAGFLWNINPALTFGISALLATIGTILLSLVKHKPH